MDVKPSDPQSAVRSYQRLLKSRLNETASGPSSESAGAEDQIVISAEAREMQQESRHPHEQSQADPPESKR